MDRFAKGFRVAGSSIILLNIIAFFLPLVVYQQTNYEDEHMSQFNFVGTLFGIVPESLKDYLAIYTTNHQWWMICCMVLPLFLALVAGVWGMVASERQVVSSVIIIVILALYIALAVTTSMYHPATEEGRRYLSGIAVYMHLICSGIAAICAIGAFLSVPKKAEDLVVKDIPNINQMKEQQVEARYNVILNEPQETAKPAPAVQSEPQFSVQPQVAPQPQVVQQPDFEKMDTVAPASSIPPYVPGEPKGIMLGLVGIYQGAQIPFGQGEWIKLGRTPDNDLVFEGQSSVSRQHCRIRWDEDRKRFVICDYSSSGTYVDGVEDCLPQNLEIDMEPGTIISIGDESNKFRLE